MYTYEDNSKWHDGWHILGPDGSLIIKVNSKKDAEAILFHLNDLLIRLHP